MANADILATTGGLPSHAFFLSPSFDFREDDTPGTNIHEPPDLQDID
jgi:hypothetical protein